jgi:molybdopterin-guanine dinucleotide biosynthesis adapter protein
MLPIVTFIGWHNCGKTTLASQVVKYLKQFGHRVAVIKSTKETGIVFDTPGSDTDIHRRAGADSVLLVAPDQMVMITDNSGSALTTLAYRYFPEVDIVIGEGFKEAKQVAKIEVFRNSNELLRDQVSGVIAVASDEKISGDHIFRLNEAAEIASFIEKRFLQDTDSGTDHTTLLINGSRVPLTDFVQEALAGSITKCVDSLKFSRSEIKEIEIRVTLPKLHKNNSPR